MNRIYLVVAILSFDFLQLSSIPRKKSPSALQKDSIINKIFNITIYKKHERPSELDQTDVMVYMKILAINSVSVTKMEYSTDLYLRQEWRDPRLSWVGMKDFGSFNSNIVSPSLKQKVWLPDLFFRNGKEGYVHKMTLPNYLMRLGPNGHILYSQKITMRFSCEMNLQTFPMDSQECLMDIGSYGYTLDEVKFSWRKEEPMVISTGLQISEFNSPNQIATIDCTNESSTSTGRYTCLKAKFKLQRQLGSYLVSTFVPSILIVMVSWLNFWINVESVPARVTLGLVTLLGMLTQATGISSTLPRVSYIKAIDVWVIACIMFVIGALLEYAVASTLARKKKSNGWEKDVREIVRHELARWCSACQRQQFFQLQEQNALDRNRLEFCSEMESLLITHALDAHKGKKTIKTTPTEDSDIDSYSRFLFPACFLLYNCFYWLYYLVLVHYAQNVS